MRHCFLGGSFVPKLGTKNATMFLSRDSYCPFCPFDATFNEVSLDPLNLVGLSGL